MRNFTICIPPKENLGYQVRKYDIDSACSTNVEKKNAKKLLIGKPEGKGPVERPRHGRVDNFRTDAGETG
jgi:hypothetical protein